MNLDFSGVEYPTVIYVLSEFPELSPVQILVLINSTPASITNFSDYDYIFLLALAFLLFRIGCYLISIVVLNYDDYYVY